MTVNRRSVLKGLALGAGGASLTLSAQLPTPDAQRAAKSEEPERVVDVLVCGGGPAGIAAAWMAARAGCKTLLLERYGRLGGAAVQAFVAPLMGNVKSARVDEILAHIGGRRIDYEFVDLKYAELLEQAGCGILLHAWAAEPLMDGSRVAGVRAVTKRGFLNIRAAATVDATGDGDIAAAAGAPFATGRGKGAAWEADGLLQPATIMFRVGGVDHAASMEAMPGGRGKYKMADGRSWNQFCAAANARGELPPNVGMLRTYAGFRKDERVLNATQVNGVDGTDADSLTKAELEARRQVPVIVDFLKKHAPGFGNAYVSGMPAILGIRETRRIQGDAVLEATDLIAGKTTDDAVVRGAEFMIDIHNPSGIGQANGRTKDNPTGGDPKVKPYGIPYGCLLPKGIDGVLTAGRCISGSHEAMASYRVQVIAMGTGVAAGAAAALAAKGGVVPRRVAAAEIQRTVFQG
jgi:hypothetical protein